MFSRSCLSPQLLFNDSRELLGAHYKFRNLNSRRALLQEGSWQTCRVSSRFQHTMQSMGMGRENVES